MKFKCSDGIYTVLRNGVTVANNASAGQAISAISADAVEVACCSIDVLSMQPTEGGVEFTVNATGTYLNAYFNYNDGADTGFVGCAENEGVIGGGDGAMYIANTDNLEFTFYSSVDGCIGYCAETTIRKYSREVTVLTVGAATVAAVPAGVPACTGTTLYTEVFTNLTLPVLNTSTGAVTIPAQTLPDGGYYIYTKSCDGILTAILFISVTNP